MHSLIYPLPTFRYLDHYPHRFQTVAMVTPQSPGQDARDLENIKWWSANTRAQLQNGISDNEAPSKTASSMISIISGRCVRTASPVASFEIEVHDLWHVCITAVKNLKPDDLEQDALV